MASDSVFTPTACYNFVNDYENDNALTNCSEPGADPSNCIEPLVPVNGAGEFILDESLCFGENQFYQMQAGQALDVPESSLPDSAFRFYTIEFLFRIDAIPPDNPDNAVYLYNFCNQSGQGSLIINEDGFICLDFAKTILLQYVEQQK